LRGTGPAREGFRAAAAAAAAATAPRGRESPRRAFGFGPRAHSFAYKLIKPQAVLPFFCVYRIVLSVNDSVLFS